jgi:hypothetical protein
MTDTSLVDFLFKQPITDKQRALNELEKIKSLFSNSADGIKSITKNSHYHKSLFNDCLSDITKAENLLNNWDCVTGANDLIARINFKRGILWGRYLELSINKEKSSKGGQATAEYLTMQLKDRDEKLRAEANQLVSDGIKTPREVSGFLARKNGLTPRQIRNILKNTET